MNRLPIYILNEPIQMVFVYPGPHGDLKWSRPYGRRQSQAVDELAPDCSMQLLCSGRRVALAVQVLLRWIADVTDCDGRTILAEAIRENSILASRAGEIKHRSVPGIDGTDLRNMNDFPCAVLNRYLNLSKGHVLVSHNVINQIWRSTQIRIRHLPVSRPPEASLD